METPVNRMESAHAAPRCHAKSKRSGKRCRSPAVRGKRVCRMHGARSGAPKGKANGRYRHGLRTQSAEASRLLIRDLLKTSRSTIELISD